MPYSSVEKNKRYRLKHKEALALKQKLRRAKPEAQKNMRAARLSPKGKYSSYRRHAKHRGIEFPLDFETFMNYWQEPCSYCGSPIDTIGLDRIDSSKGYESTNIRPCCKGCNIAKGTKTPTEYIDQCLKVVQLNTTVV